MYSQPTFYPPFYRPPRPVGVTILAILQIISGIWDVLVGTLLLLGFVFVGAFVGIGFVGIGFFSAALLVLALVAFGLAVLSFVLAYGLLKGRGWAWVWSVISAVLGLILGILGLILVGLTWVTVVNIVPIVLYAIILAYLMTRNVRIFFGRTGGFTMGQPFVPPIPMVQSYPPMAQPSPPPVAQQPYYPPAGYPQPAQQAWGPVFCPNCRAPTQPGAYFCDRCGTRLR